MIKKINLPWMMPGLDRTREVKNVVIELIYIIEWNLHVT